MWQGERCDGSNHGFCICGISACIVDLNADQPDVISAAEGILDAALVDLICAETEVAFDAIWADAIQKITEPGESEVFRAYQAKWNAAAEVIVPLVMEAQAANGIEPYTANDYENCLTQNKKGERIC